MPSTGRIVATFVLATCMCVAIAYPLAAADKAEKAAIAAFKKAMKSKVERERIQAINVFAEVNGKSVSRELKKVVSKRGADHVSAAAARAIGRRGDKKDLGYLVKMVRPLKKRPFALAGVIDAIGEYGEPRTAEVLFDVARSYMLKHKLPAQAAVRAMGNIRTKETIDLLIKLYGLTFPGAGYQRGPDGDMSIPGPTSDGTRARLEDFQPYIETSLRRLTGETISKYDIWKEWWEEERSDFDPKKVKLDDNRTLTLTDDKFSYSITRPGDGWAWVEKPDKGYQRTAHLEREGRAVASLSILAWSTVERAPDDPREVLAEARKRLEARFDKFQSKAWSKRTELDGHEAAQHTVQGTADGEGLEVRFVVCLKGQRMYVIEITIDKWAGRTERKSAEKFLESFIFLT